MKYIDADLLRDRIKKNKYVIEPMFLKGDDSYYEGENDGYNRVLRIVDSLQQEQIDMSEMSDGYHTFNELYYYRMLYNAAFFNLLPKEWVHKSKRHHTGEECFGGGWFIVAIDTPKGSYSYHYEDKYWDMFKCVELPVAKHWDGHTDKDVWRLLTL